MHGGIQLTRERKQEKERECLNKEFAREAKTGIEKNVPKYNCLLTRGSVSGELTVISLQM